jgi:hypothetical protein
MRTPVLSLVAAAALAGCSSSSNPVPLRPAAATGHMAFVEAGGATKLYLPAPSDPVSGNSVLVVLDAAAAAGANGRMKTIDLGYAGKVRSVGADGKDVVVSDELSTRVYFLDGATDTVRGSALLPAGAVPIVASGGNSYTSGVAVDATTRRAYVSVSFGIVEYDLDTYVAKKSFPSPRPENFALDRGAARLYSPFYLCDPNAPDADTICSAYDPADPNAPTQTDSLTIIDIASSQPWTMTGPVLPVDGTTRAPLGLEADAVALDLPLGLAALATEFPSAVHLLDLAKATYDTVHGTCQLSGLSVPMAGDLYTEIAVDTTTHLLIAAREHSVEVSFVDLAMAKTAPVARFDSAVPDTPDAIQFINHGDPHGITTGTIAGKPYAFLISDDQGDQVFPWIARIDLQAVKALMINGTGSIASAVAFIGTAP